MMSISIPWSAASRFRTVSAALSRAASSSDDASRPQSSERVPSASCAYTSEPRFTIM